MSNFCPSMVDKFNAIIEKLNRNLVKKKRFFTDANGKYAAPDKTAYTEVTVEVPNTITFERFTGRYSLNTKNLPQSPNVWESTVSNAVMDVDTLPRTDDLHNTSFLGTFYCKQNGDGIREIRCRMEVSLMQNGVASETQTWDMHFKMLHMSQKLSDNKYAFMAMFGLRLSEIFPDGVPQEIDALRLDKIYTEVKTSSAVTLDAGAVTTVSVISNE